MKIGDILIDGRVVGEIQLAMREEGEPSLVMPDYGAQDLIPEPSDESGDRGDYPYGGHAPGGPSEPGGPSAPVSPGTSHAPRKPGPTFRPGIGPGSQRREDRKVRTARDGPTFRRGIGPGPRHLKARQTDIHRGSGSGGNINRETRGQLTGITAEEAGVKPDFPVKSGVDWRHMDAEYVRRANKAWQMASPAERQGAYLNSGYRSTAHQWRIYNSGTRPAAKGGRSMHQFGGAGDWVNDRFLQIYGGDVGLRSGVSFNDPHHWQLSQPSGNYPTAADRSQAGRIHGQFADLDDARRGIRGAQTATPESSPTTTVAPGSTPRTDISPDATGSEYLRQERAWAKKELDEDPQLMRFVRGVIAHEQSPGERSKVFESMLNRINALRANGQPNLSIREYLSRRGSAQFYGPIRRGEITERFLRSVIDPYPDDVDRDINRVLRGSNEVLGFTDQGSRNDPNFARERASGEFVYSHGELYGDHNAAARNYRIQQQRAVAGYRDAVREAQTSRGPTPRGPHVDIGMIQEANRALPTLGPTGGFRPSTVGGDDPVTADINQALDKLSKENK